MPAAPSEKNWGEIFPEGGTSLPPPLAAYRLHPPSSSPWRPAAPVPPSGKFSKEQKCGGGYFCWRGNLPPPRPNPPPAPPDSLRPQFSLPRNFWETKCLGKFGGEPPPKTADCQGVRFLRVFLLLLLRKKILGGSNPPSLPSTSNTSWRPAAAISPSGKIVKKEFCSFLRNKIWGEICFWKCDRSVSLPTPRQHPLGGERKIRGKITIVFQIFMVQIIVHLSFHHTIRLATLIVAERFIGLRRCQCNVISSMGYNSLQAYTRCR